MCSFFQLYPPLSPIVNSCQNFIQDEGWVRECPEGIPGATTPALTGFLGPANVFGVAADDLDLKFFEALHDTPCMEWMRYDVNVVDVELFKELFHVLLCGFACA